MLPGFRAWTPTTNCLWNGSQYAMDVTILDADNDRYDPEITSIEEEEHRAVLFVQHPTSVPFSQGDRAQLILASDTYEETDPSERLKKRKAIETVAAKCTNIFSDRSYCWEITNVSAVDRVSNADEHVSLSDFD